MLDLARITAPPTHELDRFIKVGIVTAMPRLSTIRRAASTVLKWLILAFLAGVLPLPLARWMEKRGWIEDASEGLDAFFVWLNGVVTQTWFLVATAAVAGLSLGLWLALKLRRPEAEQALDDLYADGVKIRNRLMPAVSDYDHEAELARLRTWKDQVLTALRDAGVGVSGRSRFRTLNLFHPRFSRAPGKTDTQSKTEALWNENLDRLRTIMDSLDTKG